jgi:hypothetical protein
LVAPLTDFSNELAMAAGLSASKGHAGLLLADSGSGSRALGLVGRLDAAGGHGNSLADTRHRFRFNEFDNDWRVRREREIGRG